MSHVTGVSRQEGGASSSSSSGVGHAAAVLEHDLHSAQNFTLQHANVSVSRVGQHIQKITPVLEWCVICVISAGWCVK